MNCANHPETPAVAYCQYCGKPLCAECVRKVGNVVSCEPCLAVRVAGASAPPPGQHFHAGGVHFSQTAEGMHVSDANGNRYSEGPGAQSFSSGQVPPGGVPTQSNGDAQPWLAFMLGFIPGVGAMYNGQFGKGIAHVLIFVLLCDLTKYNGLIGLLIAAWVIYQIFDAYHTAIARRDGLPLPNSLGLNDIGHLFGGRGARPYTAANPVHANPAGPAAGAAHPFSGTAEGPFSGAPPGVPPGVAEPTPISGFATGYVPPYAAPPVPPVAPSGYDTAGLWCGRGGRGVPTGAVILIALGVLFLLSNFGILSENWIDRGWPIVLIAIGVWIAIRRSQTPPTGGVR